MQKVCIVGAGRVGATAARRLAREGLCRDIGPDGNNRRRRLSGVALAEGECRERDIALSLPWMLDDSALDQLVELDLDDRECADSGHTVAAVRPDIQPLAELDPDAAG
jgi:malate/lactate dehydrogenase